MSVTVKTGQQNGAANKRTEAMVKRLAREAVAPELRELRERVAELEGSVAALEAERVAHRRQRMVGEMLDGRLTLAWLEEEIGRARVDGALHRTTRWRWGKGSPHS